jgi:hypothetical protein
VFRATRWGGEKLYGILGEWATEKQYMRGIAQHVEALQRAANLCGQWPHPAYAIWRIEREEVVESKDKSSFELLQECAKLTPSFELVSRVSGYGDLVLEWRATVDGQRYAEQTGVSATQIRNCLQSTLPIEEGKKGLLKSALEELPLVCGTPEQRRIAQLEREVMQLQLHVHELERKADR